MQFGSSHRSIWRQRVVGSLVALPVNVTLYLVGLLPLQGPQLLIFLALLVVYVGALFARDGRSPIAWPLYLCEAAALALFIRETGGTTSPFQVLAYPLMFGSALTLLLGGLRPVVVPCLALLTGAALALGGWGTGGFTLFALVNTVALTSMIAALLTLNLERRTARTDPLLPMVLNRSAGLERLTDLAGGRGAFYLSFIDLGGFKEINDTYGHHVGDEVLWAVAERLRASVRAPDIVMRYGGDEFVVATKAAMPGVRLAKLFAVPVKTSAGPIPVQVDIGDVPYSPGDALPELLRRADLLMYERKRSRRAAPRNVPFVVLPRPEKDEVKARSRV